jgi:hypothetical protein
MGIDILSDLTCLLYQQIKPGNTAVGIDTDLLVINFDRWLHYTSSGTTVMAKGNLVTGATSGVTARIVGRTLEDGTDGGGDGEGLITLDQVSGTFTATEKLKIGADSDVCTVTADAVDVRGWRGRNVQAALVISEDQGINWMMDGGNPGQTGGTDRGLPLLAVATTADHHLIVRGFDNIRRLRIIDRTASSVATVKIALFF